MIRTEKQVSSTYKVVEGSRNGFSTAPDCVVSRMTLQDGILEGYRVGLSNIIVLAIYRDILKVSIS